MNKPISAAIRIRIKSCPAIGNACPGPPEINPMVVPDAERLKPRLSNTESSFWCTQRNPWLAMTCGHLRARDEGDATENCSCTRESKYDMSALFEPPDAPRSHQYDRGFSERCHQRNRSEAQREED